MTSRAIDLVTPKSLTAPSAKALEKKMETMILRDSIQYDFYFFQQLSSGQFMVWYRSPLKFTFTKHLKARKE